MNPEIKQRWIDALRSGEYKQGKGRLFTQGGFCCLGVLTDLYIKETNQEWSRQWSKSHNTFEFEGSTVYLSPSVMKWAGLPDMDPSVDGCDLSVLNDDGKSFEEIAMLIERYL